MSEETRGADEEYFRRTQSRHDVLCDRGSLASLQLEVIQQVSQAKSEEALLSVLTDQVSKLKAYFDCKNQYQPKRSELTLIHFNDVYNIQPMNGQGGAARFTKMVRDFQRGGARFTGVDPLVLFSGDAFNPSILSVSTRGSQMVPVLNAVGVDAAIYGNHDFDFGIEQVVNLAAQCKFPWILSNVRYIPNGGQPLAKASTSHIIRTKDGLRVAVIGLVEWAWMATLSTIDDEDLDYEDFVTCTVRMASQLRKEADVVIALTHMRWGNDERLAREAGGSIDIILGGHDHEYGCKKVGNVYIVKSGTDFRDFSTISLTFDPVAGVYVEEIQRHTVSEECEEDEEVKEIVDMFMDKVDKDMFKVIGETAVDLECRFAKIRTEETNIANLVADIMRHGTKADEVGGHVDVALLNAGTLRLDNVIPAGRITLGDLRALLPMVDGITVLEVSGRDLHKALENGVSKAGEMEGRFPCVSGVRFAYDPSKPAMQRIDKETIFVNELPLDYEKVYSLATKTYLANGRDGYEFDKCKVLIDDERCTNLPTLVRNHFLALSVLNGINQMSSPYSATFMRAVQRFRKAVRHPPAILSKYVVEPKVEGRIKCLQAW